MIPFPSGMFNGGYDPYGDPGVMFGASMYRDQDWEIVNTNELHLRDFKTGNFAYVGASLRREDQADVRCWVPASAGHAALSFDDVNASWATLLRSCADGISVVLAGYSKVTENTSITAGDDLMCGAGLNFQYKANSAGGATRTWWYHFRGVPYNGTNQFGKNQFYTVADAEAGVAYYHDSVPGCVTTPANSGTITTPGYVANDFVMLTLSMTSTGPKFHFNTTQLSSFSSGGVDGTNADVRPIAFHSLVSLCDFLCNSSMRTMFMGIYNEPLSANPAKLAEIYNSLKNQHN